MPKLSTTPGLDDINYLLNEAQRNRGRTVEMPWTTQDRSESWMLAVRCDPSGGDPAWLLYKGEGPATQVTFSYASGDVTLVYNLILGECMGGKLHAGEQSDSYVSLKAAKLPDEARRSGAYEALPPVTSQASTMRIPALSPGSKAILEGDLSNMQVPNLLQSIAMSKFTGRLVVTGPTDTAEVFFDEGSPRHAQDKEGAGDLAIIDLLTWEEGEFQFFPEEIGAVRSVTKRLDALLMEGVTMLDQHRFLMTRGLSPESYLIRKQASLTEADFEKAVTKGAPLDMSLQKQFYQAIDNKTTLVELLRRRPLMKTEWIPLVFNLVSCGLVGLSDRPPVAEKAAPLEAMGIDHAAIQGVMKNLARPETGIFTYPAFLYFLEQEYFRFDSFGHPFSVLIFEVRMCKQPNQLDPLPLVAVREMGKRIMSVKRKMDVVGHYETFDYGIMLPNTQVAAAGLFARYLVDVVMKKPLASPEEVPAISMAMGLAGIPEDCRELGMVLAAAVEAKNRAKQNNSMLAIYGEIRR